MKHDKTKADELVGDGSDAHFTEARRLGLRPVVRPSDGALGDMYAASWDDGVDCGDGDGPERLVFPPEVRLHMLEELVERISNVGPVKAALDAYEWFEVRVTCRQIVPDEELESDDRLWNPTGSLRYDLMASDADTARERALDRFAREAPIKCVDHYEVTAEIADHDDDCECDKCEGIEEGRE